MRFFESQGMSPEDLQRMMGGSDADTHQVLDQTAAKNASDGINEKGSDSGERAVESYSKLNEILIDTTAKALSIRAKAPWYLSATHHNPPCHCTPPYLHAAGIRRHLRTP